MRKSVWIERLPKGYSVRYWATDSAGASRQMREWFEEYGLAQKRKAELKLKFLAKQQGLSDPTLKCTEAIDIYLQSLVSTHRISSIEMKRYNLTSVLSNTIFIKQLNPIEIARIKTQLLSKYSITTVALRLRELKTFTNWCKKQGYLDTDTFGHIVIPKSLEVGRKLEIDEIQKIFANADEVFRPFLLFLIFTGARRLEILKIQWLHIDLKSQTWDIPAENSKTKQARSIPLDPRLCEALKTMPKVGVGPFTDWSLTLPHYYLQKACKNAGMSGRIRLHDFRHSYASHWTGDPRILMEKLGWKSMTMLKRYSHFNLENVRQAARTHSIGAKLELIDVTPSSKEKIA